MRKINTQAIEETVYALALKAGVNITPSCLNAMKTAYEKETGEACAFALKTLIDNSEIARNGQLPVCQDTGMAVVIAEIGQEVYLEGKPLSTAINTADNTPAVIHTEITEGDKIKLTFMPKGFGSENMSRLYMLKPAQGVEGIIDAITQTVKLAGSRPCPPVYVGAGIGGTFDSCAFLAKKALTRDIGEHNACAVKRRLYD